MTPKFAFHTFSRGRCYPFYSGTFFLSPAALIRTLTRILHELSFSKFYRGRNSIRFSPSEIFCWSGKSFLHDWRIYFYSVDRITSVKNNQLCFEPNINIFMATNAFILLCAFSFCWKNVSRDLRLVCDSCEV